MLVAWALLAGLIGWIGIVLYATMHTLDSELRELVATRDRSRRRD